MSWGQQKQKQDWIELNEIYLSWMGQIAPLHPTPHIFKVFYKFWWLFEFVVDGATLIDRVHNFIFYSQVPSLVKIKVGSLLPKHWWGQLLIIQFSGLQLLLPSAHHCLYHNFISTTWELLVNRINLQATNSAVPLQTNIAVLHLNYRLYTYYLKLPFFKKV